jgi:hypothetical protein
MSWKNTHPIDTEEATMFPHLILNLLKRGTKQDLFSFVLLGMGFEFRTVFLKSRINFIHLKMNTKGWGCSLVVKHFSSMHKVLGLIPNNVKNKNQLMPLPAQKTYIASAPKQLISQFSHIELLNLRGTLKKKIVCALV